ncbi:MAG: DUF1643 domain-containing protein [Nocardioides sp.]|nr:DUF1643 domain-containing protein [Nocardioides sp.]
MTPQEGLFEPRGEMTSGAVLSDCGRYRYRLTRDWDTTQPRATFVMLNPSTADATVDDRTISRCITYAMDWGMGGLMVVNLYAYRATDPDDLWLVEDPIGPLNDQHLGEVLSGAQGGPVVAAWGVNAKPERIAQVLRYAGPLTALAVTKDGQPGHPLYLPKTARPQPWPAPDPGTS